MRVVPDAGDLRRIARAGQDMTSSGSDWYIFKNDQQIGPLSDDAFRKFVNEELITSSDLLWKRGLPTWTRAEYLPEFMQILRIKPPPLPKDRFLPRSAQSLQPPPLPKHFTTFRPDDSEPEASATSIGSISEVSIQQPSIAPTRRGHGSIASEHKPGNYLLRHWRGQLSLPVSYWFNGFLGYLIATIAIMVIGASPNFKTDFSPGISLLSLASVWAITLVVLCWQVVGTWRSATEHSKQSGRTAWAAIAKISLCLAVGSTGVQLWKRGGPQIGEMYAIYSGDEKVGKYTFRVLRDGAELEFSGGITFGAAKEFARFADAMGALKVVHLKSLGGRIEEAQRIGDLVKKRGLDTYVATSCLSACTIIFLNGKNRYITADAKVGFHQPNFAGLTAEERSQYAKREEGRLRQLGVSASFAKRANETPPEEMWIPKTSELIEGNVATRIVNGSRFALSGIDTEEINSDYTNRVLRSIPMYAAIERMDARSYQRISEQFLDGLKRGKSSEEMTVQVAPIINRLFEEALPNVPSSLLFEYVAVSIRHMKLLSKQNPEACYFYANPEKDRNGILADITSKLPTIGQDQREIKTKVIGAYRGAVPLASDADGVKSSIAQLFGTLGTRFGKDAKLLLNDEIAPSEYAAYCRVTTAFYEEILRLPSETRADVLRKIFHDK